MHIENSSRFRVPLATRASYLGEEGKEEEETEGEDARMLLKCLVIHHIQHTCLTYTLAVTHDDAQDGSHTFTFTYTPTAPTHPPSQPGVYTCLSVRCGGAGRRAGPVGGIAAIGHAENAIDADGLKRP